MGEHVEKLKRRWPLLDYLQGQNWVAQPAGYDSEFVGFCPRTRILGRRSTLMPAKMFSTVMLRSGWGSDQPRRAFPACSAYTSRETVRRHGRNRGR